MPGQKLTFEIPNARARTSVPTFIRESPPPPPSVGAQENFLADEEGYMLYGKILAQLTCIKKFSSFGPMNLKRNLQIRWICRNLMVTDI